MTIQVSRTWIHSKTVALRRRRRPLDPLYLVRMQGLDVRLGGRRWD